MHPIGTDRVAQYTAVLALMLDGGWRTLREISTRLGPGTFPEASISARLRDMRKKGWTVERRRAPGITKVRVFEYRVGARMVGPSRPSIRASVTPSNRNPMLAF